MPDIFLDLRRIDFVSRPFAGCVRLEVQPIEPADGHESKPPIAD